MNSRVVIFLTVLSRASK